MTRTYQEYPPSYFILIEKFESDRSEVRIPFQAKAAWARRRDFYRLREALRVAPTEDKYARKIQNLLNDLVFALNPSAARGEENCELVITINPMNEAVEKALGLRQDPRPMSPETTGEGGRGEAYDAKELERIMNERAQEKRKL